MFRLRTLTILGSKAELASLPDGKLLINTINAHSFNTAKNDKLFAEALTNGDVLIPDGVSIVKACKWIKAKSQPKERVAGWDLFAFEMEHLEECGVKSGEHSCVSFVYQIFSKYLFTLHSAIFTLYSQFYMIPQRCPVCE